MNEAERKEEKLLKIREEAHRWLDKERQADMFIELHARHVDRLTAAVTANGFLNDHNGYLLALGQLQAHKSAVSAIQTASDRAAKATRELDELQTSLDNGA